MDTFVEQLIMEQKKGKYFALVFLITLAAVVLALASALFFLPLIVLVGWGWWWLVRMPLTEYEYCVTNGDIDIDRIRGRRKRLRLVSVRGEKIESLAPCKANENLSRFDRVVRCTSALPDKSLWCFTYHSKKNGHTAVVFEPNARVLNALIDGLPYLMQREVRQQYDIPAVSENAEDVL